MNKKEITLRKGQCPFEKLQEIVAETNNAWIFIHKNVYDKMYIQEEKEIQSIVEISYLPNQLIIDLEKDPGSCWLKIRRLSSKKYNFLRALDPENLVFLKAQD